MQKIVCMMAWQSFRQVRSGNPGTLGNFDQVLQARVDCLGICLGPWDLTAPSRAAWALLGLFILHMGLSARTNPIVFNRHLKILKAVGVGEKIVYSLCPS